MKYTVNVHNSRAAFVMYGDITICSCLSELQANKIANALNAEHCIDILDKLSAANISRDRVIWKCFGKWKTSDWGMAIAGEVGEMCNKAIHLLRGDKVEIEEIGDEAADIVIYLDFFCQELGFNLKEAIVRKFNKKSKEKNCDITI